MTSAPPTVVELLAGSKTRIIDDTGTARTCGDVLEAGRVLAADLGAAGIEPGDRIAVQMTNDATYLDLLAAAAVGGFVIVSVNLRFADAMAESIITRSGARMVVRSADDLPDPGSEPSAHEGAADDRFVVFTTSGTTSAPKLVAHTQRSIAEHARDVALALAYDADHTVLVPLPLCGVFGFTVLFAAIAGDATVVLPAQFDVDETAALIERHRVTSLHATDDMFHRMLATDHDLSSVTTSGYGRFNSALDGIVERCADRGVSLSGLYGMSEIQALFAWRGRPEVGIENRWRAGGPLVSPRASCRVVDGELHVQGPSMFEGYLANGGASIDRPLTDASFDGPWFRTGDLAAEDGERSFEYVARMGDAMRLGGFLVAPAEIEAVVLRHAGISQVQVVAASLERGARPVAFVISDGAPVDEASVIEHCRSTLALFKCPVRVVRLDEFPVTDGPNGVKIQRAELRRRAEAILAEDPILGA